MQKFEFLNQTSPLAALVWVEFQCASLCLHSWEWQQLQTDSTAGTNLFPLFASSSCWGQRSRWKQADVSWASFHLKRTHGKVKLRTLWSLFPVFLSESTMLGSTIHGLNPCWVLSPITSLFCQWSFLQYGVHHYTDWPPLFFFAAGSHSEGMGKESSSMGPHSVDTSTTVSIITSSAQRKEKIIHESGRKKINLTKWS